MTRRPSGPAPIPAPQLERRLADEAPPAVVVLAGAEAWFRARSRAALVTRALPDGDPGGALVRIDGRAPDEASGAVGVLDELRSQTLFAPSKVVIVENADGLSVEKAKSIREALLSVVGRALEAAPPGSILILETPRPVKGKSSVPAAALIEAGAWVVDCRPLYDAPGPWERGSAPHDHELARFLAAHAKHAYGKRMDAVTAHRLTTLVGSELADLDGALSALALYAGERDSVTESDVEATVGETREDPIWKLSDAIFDRNRELAISLLEATFDRGVTDARGAAVVRPEALAAMLLATLHGAYRRVLAGSEALARGAPPKDVAREAGVPAFLAERFATRCQRDPRPLLRQNRLFLEAEVGIKGGSCPPRVAVERLVVGLLQ